MKKIAQKKNIQQTKHLHIDAHTDTAKVLF